MVQVQEPVEFATEEKPEIVELSELDLQWIGGGGSLPADTSY
jgi:hypothetical protein